MNNWFATIALLSWPAVALWLYSTRPLSQATILTILGAQLLLPVGIAFDLPMIPPLDKTSIPNLAALTGCILVARRVRFWQGFGLVEIFVIMSLVGPFLTSELNRDAIIVGNKLLPAVGPYDALSAVIYQVITLIPFILGRQFLQSSANNEQILRVLVVAGLLYSPLVLFEIRMSPQLHSWIYGYFPSEWLQAVRDGGFRPVVFLGHGLAVSFFLFTATVAAAALWRAQVVIQRLSPVGVTAYLGVVLVLCKSLGAIIYGTVVVPLVRWTTPRLQFRVAVALIMIALTYPALRVVDAFPTKTLVEMTALIDVERSASLEFRFNNEDRLLAHASERFLFGWGRFGRNRVFDEYGNDISVTDGRWIITLGQFGLIGFLAEFGLLAVTVVSAARALKFAESRTESLLLAALGMIVAVYIINLLPNSGLWPWTWLLAGALIGRAEALRSSARQDEEKLHDIDSITSGSQTSRL